MSDALVSVVTALGDDELILGHRHSEWTGFAPQIEEDVAFSSIAQDEIGHAAAYYAIVAELTGTDTDAVALGRDASQYRHAIVCERPNGDWAYTLARHWLYDHADALRLEALEDSSSEELRAVVGKIRREERYHLLHADAWMKRIVHGPVEGRTKLTHALTEALAECAGLFEPFENEADAVASGVLPIASDELRARYLDHMSRLLDELGLPTEVQWDTGERAEFVASSSGDLIASDDARDDEQAPAPALGGRRGERSDAFKELWDVMTIQYRENPGATW